MANDIEQEAAVVEDVEVEEETLETPTETTDWEQRAKKLEEKAIAQRERTRMLKAEIEKLKKSTAPKPAEKAPSGELDETAMLLLEVKGIKTDDSDEMKLVDEWRDAGKSVKAMLANKIFQAELKELRTEKEVQNAMPSATKRTGTGAQASVEVALAEFERTGKLPTDFKLRAAVVNAQVLKENHSLPPWQRR